MALLREDKTLKPDFTYFGMVYGAASRIAQRFHFGEQKYARGNWREAKEVQTYKESVTRHLFQYLNGDTDEDHLAAVAVNTIILMDLEEQQKATNPVLVPAISEYCQLCEGKCRVKEDG